MSPYTHAPVHARFLSSIQFFTSCPVSLEFLLSLSPLSCFLIASGWMINLRYWFLLLNWNNERGSGNECGRERERCLWECLGVEGDSVFKWNPLQCFCFNTKDTKVKLACGASVISHSPTSFISPRHMYCTCVCVNLKLHKYVVGFCDGSFLTGEIEIGTWRTSPVSHNQARDILYCLGEWFLSPRGRTTGSLDCMSDTTLFCIWAWARNYWCTDEPGTG